MKRSKAVALSLMGASALLLQACDDPDVEAKVYRDVKNCIDTGDLTPEQCIDMHKEALKEHLQNAPRFASRDDCYAQFGANDCQGYSNSSGGSVWLPLMMGFLASRALDSYSQGSAPLYRTRQAPGSLTTGNGYSVGNRYGSTARLPEWATQPTRSRTQTISRGGFGARSSGWGG